MHSTEAKYTIKQEYTHHTTFYLFYAANSCSICELTTEYFELTNIDGYWPSH